MNSAPKGWYVDPSTGTNLRFWSGNTWTDEVAPLPDEPTLAGPADLFGDTPGDTTVDDGHGEPVAPVPSGDPVPASAEDGSDEGGLDPDLEVTLLTRRELRLRRGSEDILDDAPKHLPPSAIEVPTAVSIEHWIEPIEELEIPAVDVPRAVTTKEPGAAEADADADPNRKHRILRMSVLLGILTVATSVAVLTAGSL